jgi:hypothetical protein
MPGIPFFILWSPTGKALDTLLHAEWGDISRPLTGRIHPRPKAVAFCCRGKYPLSPLYQEGVGELEVAIYFSNE